VERNLREGHDDRLADVQEIHADGVKPTVQRLPTTDAEHLGSRSRFAAKDRPLDAQTRLIDDLDADSPTLVELTLLFDELPAFRGARNWAASCS
jgi:hypothetical protein